MILNRTVFEDYDIYYSQSYFRKIFIQITSKNYADKLTMSITNKDFFFFFFPQRLKHENP